MLSDINNYVATCPRCKKPDMVLEVCGDLGDKTFLCKFFCLKCGFETTANMIPQKFSIDDLRKIFEVPIHPRFSKNIKMRCVNFGIYIGHTLFRPITSKGE